jgi:hypothetical protein
MKKNPLFSLTGSVLWVRNHLCDIKVTKSERENYTSLAVLAGIAVCGKLEGSGVTVERAMWTSSEWRLRLFDVRLDLSESEVKSFSSSGGVSALPVVADVERTVVSKSSKYQIPKRAHSDSRLG